MNSRGADLERQSTEVRHLSVVVLPFSSVHFSLTFSYPEAIPSNIKPFSRLPGESICLWRG